MEYYPTNLKPPEVSYNEGDYRTISKLDRNRAELAKTARLEAELEREKMWKNILFQKKLEELQKSLAGPSQVGGGATGGGGGATFASQQGGGGVETSMDRMFGQNPELERYLSLLRSARMITGPNANPYALGYNFGTLTGKGGYFGKPAPVPELPDDPRWAMVGRR